MITHLFGTKLRYSMYSEMSLHLKNITGRISLVALQWVTHKKVQQPYVVI